MSMERSSSSNGWVFSVSFLFFLFLLSFDGGGFYISTSILLPLTFTAAFRFRFLYNFQLRLSRTYRECFVESVQVNQNSMSAVTKHRRVYTRHLDESEKCGGALASFIYFFESIFLSSKSVNWAVCFVLCVCWMTIRVYVFFHFIFSFSFDICWSFGLFSLFWKSLVVACRRLCVMNNEMRTKIASFSFGSFLFSFTHYQRCNCAAPSLGAKYRFHYTHWHFIVFTVIPVFLAFLARHSHLAYIFIIQHNTV